MAALVHASAAADDARREQQERFILTRLSVAAFGLGLAPAYLAWRGTVGMSEMLLVLAAALVGSAAVILSRSGRFALSHVISACGFAAGILGAALATGGMASPLLPALALLPLEASVTEDRAVIVRAGLIALAALAASIGFGLPSTASDSLTMPLVALLAVLQTTGFAAFAVWGRRCHATPAPSDEGRLALDHVGDLVTLHDRAGNLLFANAAADRLIGLPASALLGRGLFDRVHVADRPLFLKTLSDATHHGEASARLRVLIAAGEGAPQTLWLDMQARAAETGAEPRVACTLRDVTARHALEQELEQAHAEALKASDVKGRFLATVSHELRTPLNAIIGFSEMLSGPDQSWIDGEKRLEYAKIIHSSGHHLLDVVNTLLDISKIESGTMALDTENVDLAALAGDCRALMALRAEAGSIVLDTVIGPNLPAISADRRALKQVMLNLISNAIKFTPPQGRVVLALVRDGDMVDISVSDTGIGISAGDLPRLGDPFFQARSAYDRNHEGTGLGLSVVRGLVGLHGGSLSIESAIGVGTRVCVRLPIGEMPPAVQPVSITTFARAPRRGLDAKEPFRLTA